MGIEREAIATVTVKADGHCKARSIARQRLQRRQHNEGVVYFVSRLDVKQLQPGTFAVTAFGRVEGDQ